jgi:hypothetical protein
MLLTFAPIGSMYVNFSSSQEGTGVNEQCHILISTSLFTLWPLTVAGVLPETSFTPAFSQEALEQSLC